MAFDPGTPGAVPSAPKLPKTPKLTMPPLLGSTATGAVPPMKMAAGFGSIKSGLGAVAKNTRPVRTLKNAVKRGTQSTGEKITRFGRN